MDKERLTLTIPEVAKLLGINKVAAYRLAKHRDFPAITIGRRIVVPKTALELWLEKEAWRKEELK